MKNKKITFGIVLALFLLVIPFSFAAIEQISGLTEGDSIVLSSDILRSDFVSWNCQSTAGGVQTIFIDECYCNSVQRSKGVGYGNLLGCISRDNSIITSDPSFFTIDITYDSKALPGRVTIELLSELPTLSSSVSCVDSNEASIKRIYTFFNPSTGQVFYRGSRGTISLADTSITTLDSISCQVAYYDQANLLGYVDSTNVIPLLSSIDGSFQIKQTYLAPAYPEFNEELFCYGFANYSYPNGIVEHTFEFFKNGVLVNSTTFTDSDPSSSEQYSYSIRVDGTQGTEYGCEYSVKRDFQEAEVVAEPVVVTNAQPTIPFVSLVWDVNSPKGVAIAPTPLLNSDGQRLLEFRDSGDVLLKGNCLASTECLNVEFDGGSYKVDSFGNLCVENGCYQSDSCPSQSANFLGDNGPNTITIGQSLCYTGDLYENYFETIDTIAVQTQIPLEEYCVGDLALTSPLCRISSLVGSVSGECSPALDFCESGTYFNTSDSSTQYNWACAGYFGGVTDFCSSPIPTQDGVCGSTQYTCDVGYPRLEKMDWFNYTWICSGISTGSETPCSIPIITTFENGVCGSLDGEVSNFINPIPQNREQYCTSGNLIDFTISSDDKGWQWSCMGANGGSNSVICETRCPSGYDISDESYFSNGCSKPCDGSVPSGAKVNPLISGRYFQGSPNRWTEASGQTLLEIQEIGLSALGSCEYYIS